MKLYPLFLVLVLAACNKEGAYLHELPVTDTYIYSGEFMVIDDSYILVGEDKHPNDIGRSPIQFTVDLDNSNLVYTLYGKQYGIYEVDLFVEHIDCLDYNGGEHTEFGIDQSGNDVVRITFIEDYWKKCYLDDDTEKPVSFILKSQRPIFQ